MRSYGRPRVLVCDDEETVREICARALRSAGYDMIATASGGEAIAVARLGSFDVALVDVRLPDFDGPEVIARLHERDVDLPCVVMSAYASFDDAVKCLHHGAVDFVRKPFDLDTLVRAIDRAIATTHLKADSAVLAATRSIFALLDAREIGRRVLEVARTTLNASRASITLAGPDGPGETYGALDMPLSPSAWRRLTELRDPAIFSQGAPIDQDLMMAVAPSARTMLAIRLTVGERLVGVLTATRAAGEADFGERDLRRASLLAGHASLALDNARLHAELEAQTSALEHAADRLIAAERVGTLARLAASLGHEIANPAFAVLASLELAETALPARIAENPDTPDSVLEAIIRARAGANAILSLCEALRPLSQGRGRPRSDLVDLRQVISGAATIATYEVRPRARLTVDVDKDLPLLRGDAARLGQVFLNLLLNAAQAIPTGHPEEHEIRVSARVADDAMALVVRVEDTGPGVPSELLPNLFEPSTTSRAAAEGHGMGLAVCRWIVEEAGGSIRHVSGSLRGACFEVRLALKPGRPVHATMG
jgi:C4-dicarboxylate-specific signal transduction histidine kinase/FixJ family two-component response regulator